VSQYFEAHKEAYAAATTFEVTALYFNATAGPADSGNGQFAEGADADAASSGHGALTDATAARLRAAAARAAIESGTPVEQVANLADPLPFAAPGTHVSPRTLANYFGPGLADAVGHLAVGHTTDVTQLGNGVVLIYLNNKTPGQIPSLASVRELVAADALRDRQEHALEALLASLRQSAHVELATASR
jgi:parvulin-like peptidyl-prolyl isomerase